MASRTESDSIEQAKLLVSQYAEANGHIEFPLANIHFDNQVDDVTRVHMNIEFNGNKYRFDSIEKDDLDNVYKYLYSQPIVREKYAQGNILSLSAARDRVQELAMRFHDKKSNLYLYSGFIVRTGDTKDFIGLVTIGAGDHPGIAELGYLNRPEYWSYSTTKYLNETETYNIDSSQKKQHLGVGTMEVVVLLQYGRLLKDRGYLINGQPLRAIDAFSRLDNYGSWKACIKAGMKFHGIRSITAYGDKPRIHLRKELD